MGTSSRPALWGFFISLACVGITLAIRFAWKYDIERTWTEKFAERDRSTQTAILQSFQERSDVLLRIAKRISKDTLLINRLRSNNTASVKRAFDDLQTINPSDETSIDIIDPRGTIVAWTGKSITKSYESLVPPTPADSSVVVLQSGLETYLSVGYATKEHDFIIIASEPLEVQYPIANRFVARRSFSELVSSQVKTEVWIALNSTSQVHLHQGTRYIPVRDFQGNTIAYMFYVPETVASTIQNGETVFGNAVGVLSAIAAGFLAFSVFRLRIDNKWLRLVSVIILVWGIRILLKLVGFPSSLGSPLFDPTIYSSPFPLGLSSSIGELFFSLVALSVTMAAVQYTIVASLAGQDTRPKLSAGSTLIRWLSLPLLVILFLWFVRGYSETLRTFVFDSVLQYNDPIATFLQPLVALMFVNVLLLTMCLLSAFVIILVFVRRRVFHAALDSNVRWWAVVTVVFSVCVLAYYQVDTATRFPVSFLVLVLLAGLALSDWVIRGFLVSASESLLWRLLLPFTAASFLVAMPLLDQKLHEKEKRQVEVYAENLARPVDNWLSFVVSEGLRTVSGELAKTSVENLAETNSGSGLAFSLWAQTLMSHEGYNSAVVVYDRNGREISRFAVGMSGYEQRELLTKLFERDEEVVQVIDQKLPAGIMKYYGVWGTIRDENNQLIGNSALMLSASQRLLFRGEATEPLKSFDHSALESPFRQVFVSEFERGYLVSTDNDQWYPDMPLPADVVGIIRGSGEHIAWVEHPLGNKRFETLYVFPEGELGRIVAISLEKLDLRWHLFNTVKVLFVYALILVVIGVGWMGTRLAKGRTIAFGFRAKLVSAFGVLMLVPLFLLGYYNRELATERLEENIRHTLSADLELVQQRIVNSISGDEDFLRGVNDDYCEVVASELGVDFTVFRRWELHASSRPELYQAGILDPRLPGEAFANVVIVGKNFLVESEKIGEVQYAVGYKPIEFEGRMMGVLAIPTLYRQREIDEELAQRNAFVLGAYSLVFILMLLVSVFVATRLSRPIRDLTEAANAVGKGDLGVRLVARSSDEVGNLMKTFNAMVDELRRSRDELKRVEREMAWKEMAKQVAHEIKNPLTPMKLSMQHLRQAFKDKSADREALVERIAQTIIEQIDTLSRIATEFSNFARMPERTFERFNLQEVLQESVTLFRELNGIEFRTKFPDTAISIVADKDEMRRIFINIIRNSIQAMGSKGVVSVEADVRRRICHIRISDTGPGIPEDIRARVFQPNFSTKTDGMGLGLAIAQKAIQELNGTIELRSEVGKGTTVEMRIPL